MQPHKPRRGRIEDRSIDERGLLAGRQIGRDILEIKKCDIVPGFAIGVGHDDGVELLQDERGTDPLDGRAPLGGVQRIAARARQVRLFQPFGYRDIQHLLQRAETAMGSPIAGQPVEIGRTAGE